MRYQHWIGFALLGSIAASLAAQGTSSVRTSRARISSPGLFPDGTPPPAVDPRRKRVVETPPQVLPEAAAREQQARTSPSALVLACLGAGTSVKHTEADFTGDVFATISGTRDRAFADEVDVELVGQTGRIRLPRTMLPPINGGTRGWFEFRKLQVTDRAITGTAGVNFMNRPKVHIDRVTGTITIAGKNGDFNGRCRRVDPNAERQF